MQNKREISIVVPAYNEEEGIKSVVQGIIETVESTDIEYELIIVNDGSTDNTSRMVEGLSVKLINHQKNKGYGAALKTGIRNSKYENVLIIDADGTYAPEYIPVLLNFADENDMVVGARTGADVKIPLIRKPAKWILNQLANYLAEAKIPDLNSGIRIMKKSVINEFIRILPDGFSFTTTITLATLTNDYQVEFVPINYNKRDGKSKIRPIYDTLNFLQLIIRTIMYFNPLKVFLPFSLLFISAGICFLVRDVIHRNLAQSSVLLLITGGIVLSIGMLADLIDKRLK
jgi:glycosyltransferase involved in cell wall biosynthesis